MFRRYPYWGWLLLSLSLWGISSYYFFQRKQAMLPERMARMVNNDVQYREDAYKAFTGEQELIRRMFADSLSVNESKKLTGFPFYIYGFDNDTLKYWSTNIVIAELNDSAIARPVILRNEKGVFLEKCVRLPYLGGNKKMVILFPVLITYPLENVYLKSHFAASGNIPVTTKIIDADQPVNGAYPIALHGGIRVFSLEFNLHEFQKWIPDSDYIFISLLIATLFASIWWLQLIIIYLTRKRSPLTGFIVTLLIVVIFKLLLYKYGLPYSLETITFFSSSLYASSDYLRSLGDLFINTLCVLWLVIFITRHTLYRTYFSKISTKSIRWPLALILICLLLGYAYFFVNIIRSLVLDSNISFDVSHYYSINIYTIIGLLVIGIITGISCLIIYLFNVQLSELIHNKWVKYLLIAATGVLLILLTGRQNELKINPAPFDWVFYWTLLGWLMLFIPLLDIRNFSLVSDLFEPHMIFWAVFICMFCTGILQYFNQEKEKVTRIAFVNLKLSPPRDNMMESLFDKTARIIEQDAEIKNFFSRPSASSRKTLDQYFDAQYLGGYTTGKYQSKLYLFDAAGRSLYNKDTSEGFATLMDEKSESELTKTSYLFYKEDIHERHFYLSYIPVYQEGINKILGYIFIDFDQKKRANETVVYNELLQTGATKESTHDNEYTYAVYLNGKLNSQTNDYAFPAYLKNDTLKQEQDHVFITNHNISELYYKISDKRTIVIVHIHSQAIEMITLFSYLFVIMVLLAGIILLYQLYLSYFSNKISSEKFIRLTLRRRVHFSMLGVVLISFIIIGFVTILFFSIQYGTSNRAKLQSAMQLARQTIQENLRQVKAFKTEAMFDSVARSNSFKSFITTLANGQVIDINLFNRKGVLLNTSEDEIYNKGLISNRMRPDAFYQLNDLGKSIHIQDERIAYLYYLSAYQPLRDEHGITFGYINVPFFSSEKDLKFQISNIVVTLINLYAFIFLFSSLITVFITRWITKSFSIIIQQFERINLQKNERIVWPYDDEIGLLVSEYNKMVNKVEENAAMLAQSERESAWREMARQVAHEIKNPLTPMKLNVQFLRQEMKNDNPQIKELTDKLTNSIVEQIDNLSYIASEFSNFAKMPEARPEELELGELLNKAVELYRNDANTEVSIKDIPENLFVYSDRSQLLRVFSNLLENAKQSIPDDRHGKIDVSIITENQNAIITIKDNGQGIPDDVVVKLFQPYFTTKSSGTGLGLAMTKKIIEFWKGDIWFETKIGEGTTFYIKLPVLKK